MAWQFDPPPPSGFHGRFVRCLFFLSVTGMLHDPEVFQAGIVAIALDLGQDAPRPPFSRNPVLCCAL